jgi:hypothetical protein
MESTEQCMHDVPCSQEERQGEASHSQGLPLCQFPASTARREGPETTAGGDRTQKKDWEPFQGTTAEPTFKTLSNVSPRAIS